MHIYYLQIMYRSLHIMLLSRDQHKGGRKEEKIKYTISLTPEPKNSILKCFQYFNLYIFKNQTLIHMRTQMFLIYFQLIFL